MVFRRGHLHLQKKNCRTFFNCATSAAGYPRVIRSEGKPETSMQLSQAGPKSTFVRLFRLKDTDEIGYWDGEKFVPLWPERYTKLIADNTAFANTNKFDDIW